MKKNLAIVVFAAAQATLAAAWAAGPPAVTEPQRAQAIAAARQGVPASYLVPGAPATYTVQRGDTLWRIAGIYLRSPWRWPALWGMNLDEVHNPHLIYPGEVLVLDVVDGRARLSRRTSMQTEVRLSPGIRIEDQVAQPIPTLSYEAIRPFLTRPLLMDDLQFREAGTITATQQGRLNVGSGGRIYASGLYANAGDVFSIYRPGRVLKDPETQKIVGVESIYLGTARLVVAGTQASLDIVNSVQEVGRGDRLLKAAPEPRFHFAPRLPEVRVDGRIITLHDGRTGGSLIAGHVEPNYRESEGGALSIVVINRGANDGLRPGHVLELARPGALTTPRSYFGYVEGRPVIESMSLPTETYGNAMIFKTFDQVSYAIVLTSRQSVQSGDVVATPPLPGNDD